MFAIISRGGPKVRSAYICASCVRTFEAHPSNTIDRRSQHSNASFSTTPISRQDEQINAKDESSPSTKLPESGSANDGEPATGSGQMKGNPPSRNAKRKTKTKSKQAGIVARRKENLSRILSSKKKSGPMQFLYKLYQDELDKNELAKGTAINDHPTISDSSKAMDALRESMFAEDARSKQEQKQQTKESSVKGEGEKEGTTPTRISKSPKKKAAGKAPGTVASGNDEIKTKSPGTVEAKPKGKTSKGVDGSIKSGKPKSSAKARAKDKKPPLPVSSVKPIPSELDAKSEVRIRKIAPSELVTKYPSSVQVWAKKWIDAIAANADSDTVALKRKLLLDLIDKGNLRPSDVAPAVGLLRSALEVDSKKNEFQSIRQAMQGGEAPPARIRLVHSKSPAPGSIPLRVGPPPPSKKSEEKKSKKLASSAAELKGTTKLEITTVNASDLKLSPLETGPLDVPKLSYGLERVLFNPGVYQLQDPRSRVFNFDPYLQTIMPVSEFDFSALKQYMTSSQDPVLLDIAKSQKMKYTGSTSSMTSALGHFHFLLSQWRPINPAMLSRNFPAEFSSFTLLQRAPTAIFLRYKDGTYAIDADKEYDTANILSSLGKSMEKLLTLPTNEFERYRKPNSSQISEEERNESEAFHYTTMGDFLMRSQLDAYDPRLPGTGMFDLKTRAVVAIRMDTSKYEEGSGYEIRHRHGEWESYEREYYDMIRAAFLKYSLQVRMGRMDGIFVAFHNTERIFGFQYVSLSEMDYALHGTENTTLGDAEFRLSVEMLNRILDRATAKWPEKSLRLFFETREADTPFMYIFAEPVEEDEIDSIQSTNKAEIDAFEARVLGLSPEASQAEWDNLQSKVEDLVQKDEVEPDVEEDNSNVNREVWTEQMENQIGEFLNAAAQDDGSQDNEEEDVEDEESQEDEIGLLEDEQQESEMDDEQSNIEGEETSIEEIETNADDADPDLTATSVEELHDERENGSSDAHQTVVGELVQDEISPSGTSDQNMAVPDDVDNNTANTDFIPDEPAIQSEAFNGEVDSNESLERYIESQSTKTTNSQAEESTSATEEDIESVDDEPQTLDGVHDSLSREVTGEDGQGLDTSDNILFTIAQQPRSEKTESILTETSDEEVESPSDEDQKEDEILAMILTIRNKVNNQYIKRPSNLQKSDRWEVEYSIAEVPSTTRARRLYDMSKGRRSKTLGNTKKADSKWNNEYVDRLMKMARKGRELRKEIDEKEKDTPKKVLFVGSVDGNQATPRDVSETEKE